MATEPDGFSYGHFVGEVNAQLKSIQTTLSTMQTQQSEQTRFVLNEMKKLEDKLEEKTDNLELHMMKKVDNEKFDKHVDAVGGRIGELERWRYYLLGAGAVGVVVASFLAPYITDRLFHN